MAIGLALGVALGGVLGLVLDRMAFMAIGIGLALGAVFCQRFEIEKENHNNDSGS